MVFGFPGFIEVLIISVLMSLTTVLISKFATNQSAIKSMKAEMKSLNAKIKKAQKSGDSKEISKHSGELMKLSGKQMQMNMKPMMVSLVFYAGLFWFFGVYYLDLIVMSPVSIPFIGNNLNWFYWYLLIVLPGSFLFRKLLAVE
jgi:uncharacterized membrane protein (DUF106 family)